MVLVDFGYSCLFHLAAHLKTILLILKLELAGLLALGSNAAVPSADLASIVHVDQAINIAPAAVCEQHCARKIARYQGVLPKSIMIM